MLLSSCTVEIEKDSLEKWKNEIVQAEMNFSAMAAEKGIPEAFISYAAEDAVLMRNNRLVVGKQDLIAYLENQPSKAMDEKLSWKPDFVDVSASGIWAIPMATSTIHIKIHWLHRRKQRFFHTVWKKQDDGSWKFLWE